MTLENIYYIGQTIAVAAILASLLFVGRQLQQSKLMERAAAQRDLLRFVSDFTTRFFRIDAEGDFLARGLLEYDAASAAEQGRVNAVLAEFVFITESALNMHRDGFLSEGTWAGIEGGALAFLRTPGGAQWWRYGQNFIGTEIVEHLKRRLAEVDPGTPTALDLTPTIRRRLEELRTLESTDEAESFARPIAGEGPP